MLSKIKVHLKTVVKDEIICNVSVLQTITNLTTERDNAKKIARQELEIEKRELENKIASLYQEITQKDTNRDQVMALLHSRLNINT